MAFTNHNNNDEMLLSVELIDELKDAFYNWQSLPYADAMNKTLVFAIFDFDRFSKHDQIGEVKVPLCQIDLAQTIEEWRELQSVEGEGGQVCYAHKSLELVLLCLPLNYITWLPPIGAVAVYELLDTSLLMIEEVIGLVRTLFAGDLRVLFCVSETMIDKSGLGVEYL